MAQRDAYIDNNDDPGTDGFIFHLGECRVGVVLELGQVHLDVVELEDGPEGQILKSIVHGWREEL